MPAVGPYSTGRGSVRLRPHGGRPNSVAREEGSPVPHPAASGTGVWWWGESFLTANGARARVTSPPPQKAPPLLAAPSFLGVRALNAATSAR
jgi:hypothetical protein